jgi:hypothetical protein
MRLEDTPDSAYGQHPAWDDDLSFEDMSRTHYNRLKARYDIPEHNQARHDEAIERDESSGYNWGPPPDPNYDPGMSE